VSHLTTYAKRYVPGPARAELRKAAEPIEQTAPDAKAVRKRIYLNLKKKGRVLLAAPFVCYSNVRWVTRQT